jgi:acyl dehydratase
VADASHIGLELDELRFPVDASKVRELALTAYDGDPVYVDEDAARAAGYPAIPAPLNVAVLAMHWRVADDMLERLELDLRRLLHGEVGWEYLDPVYVGDELTATRRVRDVTAREGKRGGTMTLVVIETEFRNQDGELVMRQNDTIIETGG